MNPARGYETGMVPQLLAGRTEVSILLWQPAETLAAPDALVLVAKAGGWDEGGDVRLAQVEIVGSRPVLSICYHFSCR